MRKHFICLATILAVVLGLCVLETQALSRKITPEEAAAAQARREARAAAALKAPTMIELGEPYKTPDGMTLNKNDGNIYFVVPAALEEGDAPLLIIKEDDTFEEIYRIPASPETGHAGTLGIAFGPDGNLYVADSQDISGHVEHNGRLLRVVFEDGKPVRTEVLATNFVCPNGLDVYGNKIYFAETRVTEDQPSPLTSGVFCFDIAELDPANPYKAKTYVSADDKDPHFIFQFETKNPDWRVGANGLGLSADGKLYVANFGDAQVYELTLAEDGMTVKSVRDVLSAAGQKKVLTIDGLKICDKNGLMYFADFGGNAIHVASIKDGWVKTLAKNPVDSGVDGALDRCSEICVRGDKLYVSNIDLPFDNENNAPHAISVIQLNEKGL